MTIHWLFYNFNSEYFEARLGPSIADHLFSFNLAVRIPSEDHWMTAAENFVSGRDSGVLKIRGERGQNLYMLVKDDMGVEKNFLYEITQEWPKGGEVIAVNEIADYHKHFVHSQGMNENDMYCKALFEEYKALQIKTTGKAQILKIGEPYKINEFNPQDEILKKVVAKELHSRCQSCFVDRPLEWSEIEEDALD